jgi:nitrogen regulatory protein P-II 1
MKKIEAIIRTSKFEHVYESLSAIGLRFLSFMEIKGFGMEEGASQTYRGATYDVGFIPRTKLEIVVTDEQAQEVIDCILKVAHTGHIGDGKIFVYDVEKAYRIRTGEEGPKAL